MTWEDTTKEEAEAENRPCRDSLLQWEDSLATQYGKDGAVRPHMLLELIPMRSPNLHAWSMKTSCAHEC